MVTREQMDLLSTRVSGVLELISDLRVENSHLKAEVDQLEQRRDQCERKIDEQTKESIRLREQLEERDKKLNEMVLKEEELENFMLQMIGQMDGVRLQEYQKEFLKVADMQAGIEPRDEASAPVDTTPAEVLQVEYDTDGGVVVETTTADRVDFEPESDRALEVVFDEDEKRF